MGCSKAVITSHGSQNSSFFLPLIFHNLQEMDRCTLLNLGVADIKIHGKFEYVNLYNMQVMISPAINY